MTCFHPITAWKQTRADYDLSPKDYYALKKLSFREVEGRQKIKINCGHCLGCRMDHADMWATRCFIESKNWSNNCFVTLTYNTPNLPLSRQGLATLRKKDLQDFFKRLRYYHKGAEEWHRPDTGEFENPIRYFGCGEYGPRGGRPHYHVLIFNWKPNDLEKWRQNRYGDWIYKSKELQKIWGKGFITVEEVNYHTAGYVCQYVLKKAGISPEPREYTNEITLVERVDERTGKTFLYGKNTIRKKELPKENEFIVMSRAVGIGRKYWEDNKRKIKRNGGILLNIDGVVKKKPIPKYFRTLWERENWVDYYEFKYKQQKIGEKKQEELLKKYNYPDLTEEQKLNEILKTREHQLRAKLKLNTKRKDL